MGREFGRLGRVLPFLGDDVILHLPPDIIEYGADY
jgi:hypothetical protein